MMMSSLQPYDRIISLQIPTNQLICLHYHYSLLLSLLFFLVTKLYLLCRSFFIRNIPFRSYAQFPPSSHFSLNSLTVRNVHIFFEGDAVCSVLNSLPFSISVTGHNMDDVALDLFCKYVWEIAFVAGTDISSGFLRVFSFLFIFPLLSIRNKFCN